MKNILFLLILSMFLIGCGKTLNKEEIYILEENKKGKIFMNSYQQITAEEAKKIMDTENDYIILDVRTKEEFVEGHIKDAILIPDYEIKNRAKQELSNKEQLILVYCRSGRRSKIVAQQLVDLGYTNIKDFGGIIDWPYDIVFD